MNAWLELDTQTLHEYMVVADVIPNPPGTRLLRDDLEPAVMRRTLEAQIAV